MNPDAKYDPVNGRLYVHACQLQPGDRVQGFEVASVVLDRPDVGIRYVGLDREVVRNAATRIYLDE